MGRQRFYIAGVGIVLTLAGIGLILPQLVEAQFFAQLANRVIRNTRTTAVRSTLELNVPFYRQERNLSCEIAALRMILAEDGVFIAENDLFNQLPHGPLNADPNEVFVGNVDGQQMTTGYGVHWKPIASLAGTYRSANSFDGQTVGYLVDQLHAGHPVIIWGSVHSNPQHLSWETPEGRTVNNAVNGEHTWVVIGYAGDRSNPSHIVLLNPLSGREVVSTAAFTSLWSHFGNAGVHLR